MKLPKYVLAVKTVKPCRIASVDVSYNVAWDNNGKPIQKQELRIPVVEILTEEKPDGFVHVVRFNSLFIPPQ